MRSFRRASSINFFIYITIYSESIISLSLRNCEPKNVSKFRTTSNGDAVPRSTSVPLFPYLETRSQIPKREIILFFFVQFTFRAMMTSSLRVAVRAVSLLSKKGNFQIWKRKWKVLYHFAKIMMLLKKYL